MTAALATGDGEEGMAISSRSCPSSSVGDVGAVTMTQEAVRKAMTMMRTASMTVSLAMPAMKNKQGRPRKYNWMAACRCC